MRPAELFKRAVGSCEAGEESLALGAPGDLAYVLLNLTLYRSQPLA